MGPAARLVAQAAAAQEVVDAQGRRLALRRLSALDKLRLFRAAGSVLAQNPMWLGMAVLACSVTAIDDVPVPMPGSEGQVEQLVQQLGDAGLAAVGSVLAGDAGPVDLELAKN